MGNMEAARNPRTVPTPAGMKTSAASTQGQLSTVQKYDLIALVEKVIKGTPLTVSFPKQFTTLLSGLFVTHNIMALLLYLNDLTYFPITKAQNLPTNQKEFEIYVKTVASLDLASSWQT